MYEYGQVSSYLNSNVGFFDRNVNSIIMYAMINAVPIQLLTSEPKRDGNSVKWKSLKGFFAVGWIKLAR